MWSDERTRLWYMAQTAASGLHFVLSIRFAKREASAPAWVSFCLVAFSTSAFFRSTFPINWSTRPHCCLIEVPYAPFLGSDVVDRLFAQTAEVSFGFLIAFTCGRHVESLQQHKTAALARLLAWPTVLAQVNCWIGEITDNKMWHVFEETLWGSTMAMQAMLCAFAVFGARDVSKKAGQPQTEFLAARRHASVCLISFCIICLPYVYFMFSVDVPMYYGQWQADEAKGTIYDSAAKGLRRMLVCQRFSEDWRLWEEEAVWQACYFSICPIFARLMAGSLRAPPSSKEIKRSS